MTISDVQLKILPAVLVVEDVNRPHFIWALKFYSIYLLLVVDIADGHHHSVFLPILSPVTIKMPPLFLRKPVIKVLQTFNQTSWLDAITSWCSLGLHYRLKF